MKFVLLFCLCLIACGAQPKPPETELEKTDEPSELPRYGENLFPLTVTCDGLDSDACYALAKKSNALWFTFADPNLLKMYQTACEGGMWDACAEHAEMLFEMREPIDEARTIGLKTACEKQNNGSACYVYGRVTNAPAFFNHACTAGSGLGCAYYGSTLREVETSAKAFERACELGESASCAFAAQPRQTQKTPDELFELAKRGCELDNPKACLVAAEIKPSEKEKWESTAFESAIETCGTRGVGCGILNWFSQREALSVANQKRVHETLWMACEKEPAFCMHLAEEEQDAENSVELYRRACLSKSPYRLVVPPDACERYVVDACVAGDCGETVLATSAKIRDPRLREQVTEWLTCRANANAECAAEFEIPKTRTKNEQ